MTPWLTPAEAAEAVRDGRGRGVKIAVLDSGIETKHPGLNGLQLVDDVAIVANGMHVEVVPGNGQDPFGHGTAIASILQKIAPEAEIGSFRVLDGESLHSRTPIILQGAHLAIERGYHILSCSFGCSRPNQLLLYKDWVDMAYLHDVHVVAACNNADYGRAEWPAFFPSVIAVNMLAAQDEAELFYRAGHLVEFAAHGVEVEVPWTDGGIKNVTGSSFAVPRVAGLLARLLSQAPGLDVLQAKALLKHVAKPWTAGM